MVGGRGGRGGRPLGCCCNCRGKAGMVLARGRALGRAGLPRGCLCYVCVCSILIYNTVQYRIGSRGSTIVHKAQRLRASPTSTTLFLPHLSTLISLGFRWEQHLNPTSLRSKVGVMSLGTLPYPDPAQGLGAPTVANGGGPCESNPTALLTIVFLMFVRCVHHLTRVASERRLELPLSTRRVILAFDGSSSGALGCALASRGGGGGGW